MAISPIQCLHTSLVCWAGLEVPLLDITLMEGFIGITTLVVQIKLMMWLVSTRVMTVGTTSSNHSVCSCGSVY